MLTESEIREHVADILRLELSPMSKVRRLLELARLTRTRFSTMRGCLAILEGDGQEEQAARIEETIARLASLEAEIRVQARSLLRTEEEHTPAAGAYVA